MTHNEWVAVWMLGIIKKRKRLDKFVYQTLPKSWSFNEVVTLDLKEMGTKHILWMIDSFTRFIQGKLITNKKADTIIQALTDS